MRSRNEDLPAMPPAPSVTPASTSAWARLLGGPSICPAGGTYATVWSGDGTTSASWQLGQVVLRPANSGKTLNFMPHFVQENEIRALASGATVSASSDNGTTSGSLQ